ncbi:MAG: hypothetical protein AUJ52_02215 [Elusimicrobia bacterium CG1_02_63_36]|nr:MAG: hypothetical protein AUJ52_02215 [Elusimicrobia bacterium CG1_02_63_36]PIP84145.1 MAG: hypothetical protein COR54_05690 [Elusimicrobia bacterium CG22_combo_CG10-13_8_21_14_all_63_91]PJA16433.1 MAG: hypothetical protein COX66_07505 [Elusimicrobia bacterium CG_4_10_14_0_2_um_filter_63_34]PJB25691.1 MAG: hypothetical protein CO113_07340 [Elusimicrobia bacterium CG_4_9_14_3_um_filter_62_55]
MRYWVYQDSRILGPYGKEDLPTVEGLHAGSLVCPDNHSGTQEMDWAPLESYQELSAVFGTARETVAEAAAAVGSFDRFATEAHASLERIGTSENWMDTIQKDPRLSDLWGTLPEDLGPEKHWELRQSAGLENRLAELQAKLEVQESRQNEILDRLNEKDRLIADKDRRIAQLESRLRAGDADPAPMAFKSRVEPPARVEREMRSPAAPEIVPFADDMDAPEPVSRREPVESGDAVSEGPLEAPPIETDGPLILDEPVEVPGIPNIVETPVESEGAAFSAPVLEEPVSEPLAAAPALEAFPPPSSDPVPMMEDSVGVSEAVDALGIPEATPLKSVSEMPPPLEFEAPLPGEKDSSSPEVAAGGLALGTAGIAAFAEEEPPALEAPPLEAPELDAPLFDAADGPPMPQFAVSGADDIPLEPPPGEKFSGPIATPETIDLSAASESVPIEQAQAPFGDDPFAAPKTMMMGGIPGSAPQEMSGGGLNLTPPPMPAAGSDGGSGLGPMPDYPMGATPEPIPLGEGGMMGTPPPTPMPSMGQPDLPQTVMAGLGVSGMPTPMPGQFQTPQPTAGGFQDMMGGQGAPTPLPLIPGAEPPYGGPMTMTPNPAYTPSPTGMPEAEPATVPPSGAQAAKPSVVQKLKAKVGKVGGKKFLIGLVIAVLVLAGLLVMFLKNPKEVVKMAEMGPEQKTRGSFDVDPDAISVAPGGTQNQASTGGSSPFDKAPGQAQQAAQPFAQQAPQQAPAFTQRAPEPEPQAQPREEAPALPPVQPASPPRREFIQDQRIEAIEFVKGYRISGGKEVVAQKLQYYFLGGDNVPEWQAGAVEKNKWIVEYNVFKGRGGGRRNKPTVTYQFEVDLAGKSVKGLNSRARDLIGSNSRAPKRVSRRNTRRSGQTPLPSDDELSSAGSSGSGGFNNPGE